MKPPIPTKPVEKPKVSRRAALVPAIVALLGVVAVAGLVYWQDHDRPQAPINARTPGSGEYSPEAWGGPRARGPWRGGVEGFFGAFSSADLLQMRPSDQAMEGEPADLPKFPAINGAATPTRTSAFRRTNEGLAEEVALWLLPGATLEDAQGFYHSAAVQAGFIFTPRPMRPQRPMGPTTQPTTWPANRVSEFFIRPPADDARGDAPAREALLVRLWTDSPEGVHALLYYRYLIPEQR